MATNDRHSGTLRTDYETDPAQLHGLPAMESSWQRLLHRLVRYSKGLKILILNTIGLQIRLNENRIYRL